VPSAPGAQLGHPSEDEAKSVDRLLASAFREQDPAGLVLTPHKPLVIGFAARMALRSLAFSANGHFSS
jgi:hypothetical protein